MSKLQNANFNRETKLDPAPLNAKFQEVQVAVNGQVDENNIRDSSIDIPQFNINYNNGKQGIQLAAMETETIGGGTVTNASLTTPVQIGSNWSAFNGTLLEGDTIRVYWHTKFTKDWDDTAANSQKINMLNTMFAQYLEWDFNSAGYVPVPGQTHFNNNVPTTHVPVRQGAKVENTRASCLIHFVRIIDNGSTTANTAPTDPAPATSSYGVVYTDITDYVADSEHTASGSWLHTVTAPEAGSKTISFRLMGVGPLKPYYDNAVGNEGNWLIKGVGTSATLTAPTIVFSNAYIVFMVMRSK
jgi:hypothetical protein